MRASRGVHTVYKLFSLTCNMKTQCFNITINKIILFSALTLSIEELPNLNYVIIKRNRMKAALKLMKV